MLNAKEAYAQAAEARTKTLEITLAQPLSVVSPAISAATERGLTSTSVRLGNVEQSDKVTVSALITFLGGMGYTVANTSGIKPTDALTLRISWELTR